MEWGPRPQGPLGRLSFLPRLTIPAAAFARVAGMPWRRPRHGRGVVNGAFTPDGALGVYLTRPGKHTKNDGKIHHFSWENSLSKCFGLLVYPPQLVR